MIRVRLTLAVLALATAASAQNVYEWKNEDASYPFTDNYVPTVGSGYAIVKRVALDDTFDLVGVNVIGFDRGVDGDTLHVKIMADNNGLPDANRVLFHEHKQVSVGQVHSEVVPASQGVRLGGTVWVAVQMERATGFISFDGNRSDTDFLWDGSMVGKAIQQQGGRWVISRGGSLARTYSIRLQLARQGGNVQPPPVEDDHHHGHGGNPPAWGQPPVDPLTDVLNQLNQIFGNRTRNYRVRPNRSFYYYADDQASVLGAIYVPFWLDGVNQGDMVNVRVEQIPEDFAIDAGGELSSLFIAPHNGYGMRGVYWRLYDGRRYYPMCRYSGWSDRGGSVECCGCCPFEGTCYTGGGTIETVFRVTRTCEGSFRGYLILGVDEDYCRTVQHLMSRQR